MENNDSDAPVTSVDSKGPVQPEQNAQSTVSDKPPDALTPQAPDASSCGDIPEKKEGSAQANNATEVHLERRETSCPEVKPTNSSSSPSTQSYVPPVKRFSAVNINKKFLQKNQTSTATTSSASSNTTANKQPGVIARPAPQTAHSHSRLVTAKLTATPVSSSPGPGWSRPNSVTPPAPSPAGSAGPAKGSVPSTAAVGNPPQLAPGGKIIQPQVLKQRTDGPGRPAWRNVQPGAINSALQAQNEFPTAAEAAQSRLAKVVEAKAAQADLSDVQKQALSETADAFRGVHLDPNAHHWDEMEEEDNDDFLGDVIEFGDGRQYTIHVSEETSVDPKALEGTMETPISKEDRFVDDFDRSWPKSRQESGKNDSRDHGRSETSSNFSGHSPVSSRDPAQSRVLFNDRLNRMEPIPGGRTPGSHGQPRGVQPYRERPDGFAHFHGGRIERDAPPHSSFRRPHDSPWTSDRGRDQLARDPQWKSPASYFHDGYHDRKGQSDRPSSRGRGGHSPNGRTFGSREPSVARSALNGAPSVASSDHSSRYTTSVRSNRGQISQSGRRELERQVPPHFTQIQSSVQRERPAPDSRTRGYGPSSVVSTESTAAKDRGPSESEQPLRFTAPPSDVAGAESTTSAPPDDVETLRKAYLHERAERARIRRQQEEEERLKAQERARKKAEELEAKIAAAKAAEEAKNAAQPTSTAETSTSPSSASGKTRKPTESEVLRVIEGAIGSAGPSQTSSNGRAGDSRRRETIDQKSSVTNTSPRQESMRSTSVRGLQDSEQPKRLAKADQADSWRVKFKPPALPVENSKIDVSQEPAASVLPDVRAFDIQADESTEVIDFSDVSQLVGDRNSEKPVSETVPITTKPGRPVASDFFRGTAGQKQEQDSWRKPEVSQSTDIAVGQRSNAQLSSKTYVPQTNKSISSSAPSQPSHPGSFAIPKHLRSPNASYREAPLSTLDDTMSRIKGALDIMHSTVDHEGRGETKDASGTSTVRLPVPSTGSAKPGKWLPPALRQPGMPSSHRRIDVFEPTHPEPPRSPAPPSDNFVVRLPNISRRMDPLTKRQVNSQRYFAPVRWEILSFDPPVEGMTKRSLSINDVLFGKPQGPYKSRRYRVCLPKPNATRQVSSYGSQKAFDEVVSHASGSKNVADGDSGSPKSAQSNWRGVSDPARTGKDDASGGRASSMLDITSRSPPPELASRTEQVPAVSRVVSRPRSQKSLDVSNVGFYRNVQQPTVNNVSIPTVTFTVGSELESQVDSPSSNATGLPSVSKSPSQPSLEVKGKFSDSHLSGNVDQASSGWSAQPASQPESSLSSKVLDQQGDPFLHRPPVTPPPQNTPSSWSKSPARVPDPELLKAVWSQPSNNDTVPAVNSLKNIADDLPAVPFMLQEVKSEGGTPPPAPPGPVAPPTRMSASEVTRAFQTVPSGPPNSVTSSPLRGNQMPSNATSIGPQRVLKPPSIGLPPPPAMNPNAAARHPPYMSYSASMAGHTASPPTTVYSHVMPNGMAGSPVGTPYGQPMWLPFVQQGPQMLRAQSSSPYSPSMMPYAMPGGQNGMYHSQSGMQNAQGSPATYPSAPPPSQMMVSPVMAHATAPPSNAMYPASPMVMHLPPPSSNHDNRGYPPGPVGMGRGALPMQNPMDPRPNHPPVHPAHPGTRFPSAYTPVAPQTFVPRQW